MVVAITGGGIARVVTIGLLALYGADSAAMTRSTRLREFRGFHELRGFRELWGVP
ncbi:MULTISPECIES: hypothetical protein [unclassified Streptomyces]|uniref:hypothetical protein n=1 Tax=unclassified Streptomyces TaxID=2593676 RepID=UPI0033AD4A9E